MNIIGKALLTTTFAMSFHVLAQSGSARAIDSSGVVYSLERDGARGLALCRDANPASCRAVPGTGDRDPVTFERLVTGPGGLFAVLYATRSGVFVSTFLADGTVEAAPLLEPKGVSVVVKSAKLLAVEQHLVASRTLVHIAFETEPIAGETAWYAAAILDPHLFVVRAAPVAALFTDSSRGTLPLEAKATPAGPLAMSTDATVPGGVLIASWDATRGKASVVGVTFPTDPRTVAGLGPAPSPWEAQARLRKPMGRLLDSTPLSADALYGDATALLAPNGRPTYYWRTATGFAFLRGNGAAGGALAATPATESAVIELIRALSETP